MKLILAGWLTVGLALLWDKFLNWIDVREPIRVTLMVPIGEEVLKFGVIYLTKLSPLFLFAFFGLGEGIYESIHHKKKGFALILTLMAVLTHTFLSLFYFLGMPGIFSLVMATLSHVIWNHMVLNFKKDCKRSAN